MRRLKSLCKPLPKNRWLFFAFRSHPTTALATPAQSLGTAPSSPAAWPRPPLGGRRRGGRRRRRRRGAKAGPAGVDQVRKAPYSTARFKFSGFVSVRVVGRCNCNKTIWPFDRWYTHVFIRGYRKNSDRVGGKNVASKRGQLQGTGKGNF